MIATPVTLISLLLVIAHGWRQQALAENIDKIRTTGPGAVHTAADDERPFHQAR